MAAAAKAKKKALNQSDIVAKVTRWAHIKRSIATLEREKSGDPKLAALIEKHAREMQPFVEKYDDAIEKLEDKADAIHTEVIAWLEKRTKSIVISTKHAVAEFFKGHKVARNRIVDPKKFVAKCEELKKDPWPLMSVLVKDGEQLLGKKDFEAVSTKPKVAVAEATLTLKD